MNTQERKNAAIMHKNYFDKAKKAVNEGFYFEALMCEYAAIEGRIEVICGLLGCSCNKDLKPEIRKTIKISTRISCLKKLYQLHPACTKSTTKIDTKFWKQLSDWIKERNTFTHGLYKNPSEYADRLQRGKQIAIGGYDLANVLYNEANRLKRLNKSHPERFIYAGKRCKNNHCFNE